MYDFSEVEEKDLRGMLSDAQDVLDDPSTSEQDAELYGAMKKAIEKELATRKKEEPKKEEPKKEEKKEDEKKPASKAPKKRGRPKKKTTASKRKTTASKPKTTASKPKTTTGRKPKKGTKVTYKGKDYEPGSKALCDALLADLKNRRKKSKATSKKTKPVMESIAKGITTQVKKAIKTDFEDNKELFADKEFAQESIARYTALERDAAQFLESFKAVLADDYEQSEVKKAIDVIKIEISKLKTEAQNAMKKAEAKEEKK